MRCERIDVILIQQSDFDAVVDALQRAALEDSRWPATAKLVDESCGAMSSHVAVFCRGDWVIQEESEFGRVYYRGESWEEAESAYLDYWSVDPRVPRLLGAPYGRLMANRDLYSAEEWKTDPVVNEFLPAFGCGEQLLAKLDAGSGLDIAWVLTRHRDRDEWETESLRLIERLSSHLRHAVVVRQELNAARLLGHTLEEMLADRATGVVYLDRDGAIVGANPAAERILRRRDGLADRRGELRAVHPDDDAKLGGLLNGALRKHAAGVPRGGSTAIRRRNGEHPLAVHVHPVKRYHSTLGDRRPAVLVLIGDAWEKARIDPHVTGEILGLTSAEARVVALLTEGMSIREIADATGRAENTIRWQTKQAMSKTGCSRQADLVRLALAAVRPVSSELVR